MAAPTVTLLRLMARWALVGIVIGYGAVWLAALAGSRYPLAPTLLYTRWQNFESDIVIADTHGRYANLTPGPGRAEEAAWSPDGTELVYVRLQPGNDIELIVMDAMGRRPVQVTNTRAANRDPQWLPDGETLIYRFERVTGGGSYDIFTLHLPSGAFRNLTDDNPANNQLAVSPDGTQIAYTYDNRTVRLATLPYGAVFHETSNSTRSPSWSPDGEQVAYAGPQDRFASSVIDTIYILDAEPDAEPVRYIQPELIGIDQPRWSPDGSRIAFLADPLFFSPSSRTGPAPRYVYLLDVATGDVRQLTDLRGRVMSLDWSPDGARLTFSLVNPPEDSRVCFYTFATDHTACPPSLTDVFDPPQWRP